MNLVSKAALALALTPLVIIGASPAEAQKRGKKEAATAPAGPTLKLSKGFRTAAQPVDDAYKAKNWTGLLTAADAAEASATSNDDKYQLYQYRLQAAVELKSPAEQEKALNGLLATGLVAPDTAAKYHTFLGDLASNRQAYPAALASYERAEAAGVRNADLYLAKSKVYSNTKQYATSLVELDKAIAAQTATGQPVPEAWYKFGVGEASRGKLNQQLAAWMIRHVKAYPTAENWRSALVNYRDAGKLPSSAQLDLYRLMRASNSLAGERDHWDYAAIAVDSGNPGEAQLVLTPYAKTTQPDLKALYTQANARVQAGDRKSLDAEQKTAAAAANGRLAAKVGNALLGYGDYAAAITMFQTALSKGGQIETDAITTRLGIAQAMQGQKEAARATFAKVGGTHAGVAQYWTAWLDRSA